MQMKAVRTNELPAQVALSRLDYCMSLPFLLQRKEQEGQVQWLANLHVSSQSHSKYSRL